MQILTDSDDDKIYYNNFETTTTRTSPAFTKI